MKLRQNRPLPTILSQRIYLIGPYNTGPNLTPGSNCAEYKKVYISAFNGNIRHKIS